MEGMSVLMEETVGDTEDLDHALVLIAGATEEGIMREIEMITDAEILADLPRKEASTILEDIDMTYHQDQTLFTGQTAYILLAYPIKGCSLANTLLLLCLPFDRPTLPFVIGHSSVYLRSTCLLSLDSIASLFS